MARLKAEEEAEQKVEEGTQWKVEGGDILKAEEEATLKAVEKGRQKAEEDAWLNAVEEARWKAQEKARQKAEKEAILEVEEEARQKTQGGGIFSLFGLKTSGGIAEKRARLKAEEDARMRTKEDIVSSEQKNDKKEKPQGGGIFSFFLSSKSEMEEEAKLKVEEARVEAEEAVLKAWTPPQEGSRLMAMEEAAMKTGEEANMKLVEKRRRGEELTEDELQDLELLEISFMADELEDTDHVNDYDKEGGDNGDNDSLDLSLTESEIINMKCIQQVLEDQGLPPVLTFQNSEHPRQSRRLSFLSLGEQSYVRDLLNQKHQRADLIREEALEEALGLYKVALQEMNLPENEEMFVMIFQEVLQEVAERGNKKALMQDEILERESKLEEFRKKKRQQEIEDELRWRAEEEARLKPEEGAKLRAEEEASRPNNKRFTDIAQAISKFHDSVSSLMSSDAAPNKQGTIPVETTIPRVVKNGSMDIKNMQPQAVASAE
jgi:hypothetical protein